MPEYVTDAQPAANAPADPPLPPATHPAWCDRDRCNVPPGRPGEDYDHRGLAHRSAPLPASLTRPFWMLAGDSTKVPVSLWRPSAPWATETYLRVSDANGRTRLSLSLPELFGLADAVRALDGPADESATPQA